MSVLPGEFKSLNLSKNDIQMLDDAYQAITLADGWEFMKSYTPENGFMFSSEPPKLLDIKAFLKYEGHSGASYGWTMRQMEFIAKHGWDTYAQKVGLNPLALAKALETVSPSVFAGQAQAMENFANGKLTYAEMRALCG